MRVVVATAILQRPVAVVRLPDPRGLVQRLPVLEAPPGDDAVVLVPVRASSRHEFLLRAIGHSDSDGFGQIVGLNRHVLQPMRFWWAS